MSVLPAIKALQPRIAPATMVVAMDEPAWGLSETNRLSGDYKSLRRIQVVKIIRADRIVDFERSLGPASTFTAQEFVIPGGVLDGATGRGELLYTVGELMDVADYMRSDKQKPEVPEPTDLIGAYREQPERRRKWRWKRSTFGPGGQIQRG